MLCHHPNHTQFSYCKILCFFRCMLYFPPPPPQFPKHKTDSNKTDYTTVVTCNGSLPPANEVWGKVIFSQACVIPSVHRWEVGFPACITDHMTGGVCIQRGICIQGVGQTPQHYGIWSISGRHASYWNAFLFHMWLILIRMQFLNDNPWITPSRGTEGSMSQICNKWVNLIGNKVNSIMNWAGVELVHTMHQNYGKAITTSSSIVLYCSYHFDHILASTTCQTHCINFRLFLDSCDLGQCE